MILCHHFRFCLDRLKLQCQEVLVRDMTVANVCERLRAADLYGAPKLKKKALSIFQRNRQAILESRVSGGFKRLFVFYLPVGFVVQDWSRSF